MLDAKTMQEQMILDYLNIAKEDVEVCFIKVLILYLAVS
jgi:hypothetical protein